VSIHLVRVARSISRNTDNRYTRVLCSTEARNHRSQPVDQTIWSKRLALVPLSRRKSIAPIARHSVLHTVVLSDLQASLHPVIIARCTRRRSPRTSRRSSPPRRYDAQLYFANPSRQFRAQSSLSSSRRIPSRGSRSSHKCRGYIARASAGVCVSAFSVLRACVWHTSVSLYVYVYA